MTSESQSRKYVATITNSGRAGWSVIFRHPVLVDPATGQPPLRIKRGLGTPVEALASKMANDLNELLADQSYWNLAARPKAETRFEKRIVDIFFSPMMPEEVSYAQYREKLIPMPSSEYDYKRVLIIGTTGAGKTTLVRQLIGTDPDVERFPATGAGRTTTADTEIILADGPYKAVVTFSSREEIREAIDECVASAIIAAYRKLPDTEIMRKILTHVDLRFRFNYVLGNGGIEADDEEDDDDEGLFVSSGEDAGLLVQTDLQSTNETLTAVLNQVKLVAERHATVLKKDLVKSERDQRVVDDLFEEELDILLKDDKDYQAIGDTLMEEIRQRFDLLDEECLEYSRQDWPTLWHWQTDDRERFLREVRRFYSNHAPWFGTLLTPLVNGIRVAGPFCPGWLTARPNLVLIDGEGLGHSAESSSTIPSALIERFDVVDAIVLVDNAESPMLAAPIAGLRAILSSGNVDKLIISFTKFDKIDAPNLKGITARQNQVLSIAENAIRHIGNQLGAQAERDLRRRIEFASFYFEGINKNLDLTKKAGKRTEEALKLFINAVESMGSQIILGEASPMFDRLNLAMAIRDATEMFHNDWRGLLGLAVATRTSKVHWAKIKALNRRFADGTAEEYNTLAPIGDLWRELRERIYTLIKSPIGWKGSPISDEEAGKILDRFANQVSGRLEAIVKRRIRFDMVQQWQRASGFAGPGSTFDRARLIYNDVFTMAAPIPTVTPSADKNAFYREVIQAVDEVAAQCNVTML